MALLSSSPIRRRVRRASACAFVAAMLACGASDAADTSHASATLDYATPAGVVGCPDRTAFGASVATRLGYDPFEGGDDVLEVRIRREGSAVVAQMRVLADGRERASKRLASESGACDELGSAAALAAAMLLDPRAMFPKPPRPEPAPAPPRQPSFETRGAWPWYEPAAPDKPPAAPETPVRGHLGVAIVGCTGCAPSPNPAASVFGGISRGSLGVDLGARGDLPVSATSASGREVRSSLVLGEIFPHARLGPLRPGLLGSVGALFGESGGQRQTSTWAATGVRLALDVPMGAALFFRASLDASLVLGRTSLRADGAEIWSSPSFVANAGAGLGIRL